MLSVLFSGVFTTNCFSPVFSAIAFSLSIGCTKFSAKTWIDTIRRPISRISSTCASSQSAGQITPSGPKIGPVVMQGSISVIPAFANAESFSKTSPCMLLSGP